MEPPKWAGVWQQRLQRATTVRGSQTPGMTQTHPSEWKWSTWDNVMPPRWEAVEHLWRYKDMQKRSNVKAQIMWSTQVNNNVALGTTKSHPCEWQLDTWNNLKRPPCVAVKHLSLYRATPFPVIIALRHLGWHNAKAVSWSEIPGMMLRKPRKQ